MGRRSRAAQRRQGQRPAARRAGPGALQRFRKGARTS